MAIALSSYVFITIVSAALNGVPARSMIGPISFIFYFYAARYIISSYHHNIIQALPKILLSVNTAWFLFLAIFILTGRVWYNLIGTISVFDIERMNILGGRSSTELAITNCVLFCYLLYLIYIPSPKKSQSFTMTLLLLNIVLLYKLYPLNAIAAYVMIYMVFLYFNMGDINRGRSRKSRKPKLAIALGAVMIILTSYFLFSSFYEILSQKAVEEFGEGYKRAYTNTILWETAKSRPYFGIGIGNIEKYNILNNAPHQNLLGMMAQSGIIATLAYSVFLLTTLLAIIRVRSLTKNIHLFMLSIMAISCLFSIQFQGLTLDTVNIKQSYWWAGVLAGLLDICKHEKIIGSLRSGVQ